MKARLVLALAVLALFVSSTMAAGHGAPVVDLVGGVSSGDGLVALGFLTTPINEHGGRVEGRFTYANVDAGAHRLLSAAYAHGWFDRSRVRPYLVAGLGLGFDDIFVEHGGGSSATSAHSGPPSPGPPAPPSDDVDTEVEPYVAFVAGGGLVFDMTADLSLATDLRRWWDISGDDVDGEVEVSAALRIAIR